MKVHEKRASQEDFVPLRNVNDDLRVSGELRRVNGKDREEMAKSVRRLESFTDFGLTGLVLIAEAVKIA